MRLFLRQLRGEWVKLRSNPRAWMGFAAVLATQLAISLAYKLPAVRAMVLTDANRFHFQIAIVFSGLTSAAFLLANSATTVGAFFAALAGADLVAQEVEAGTLRMVLNRPTTRGRLFLQKALIAVAYTTVLAVVMGASALAVGLLFEGWGPLVFVVAAERVIGTFDGTEGLGRFALAVALLPASMATITLFAMACSCFRMKSAAAAVLTLTLLLGEMSIRRIPGLEFARDFRVVTRGAIWMKAFNNTLPTELIRREYAMLAGLDLLLLGCAWIGFRRREFSP